MSKRGLSRATSGRGKHQLQALGDGFEGWGGYMAAKKQKLKDQYSKDAGEGDNPSIFKGVAIYVNGYTKPSSDELKRLVTSHGGNYEHYLYKTRVTHIIATNLPYSKFRDLKTSKVVKPEWITDSIKAGRLLSYIPYLLYTAQGGRQQGIQNYASSGLTHKHSTHIAENSMELHDQDSSKGSNSTVSFCEGEEDMTFDLVLSDSDEEDLSANQQGKSNVSDKPNYQRNSISPPLSRSNDLSAFSKDVSPNQEDVIVPSHQNNRQTNKSSGSNMSPAKAGSSSFLNEFYSNSRLHHLSTWKSEWRDYVNKLQRAGSDFPGRKELEEFVNKKSLKTTDRLRADCLVGQKSRSLSAKPKRVVMHIDMDCFFVSVGLRKRPELKGKPIAVTHSRGQGQKNPTPGSDLTFEKQQWELRHLQGGKKGKQPQQKTPIVEGIVGNIDEDTDEDEEEPDFAKLKSDSFHSMAEIASCSYEARQAGVRNGMFMGNARKLCPDLITIPYDFEGYQEVSRQLYDTVANYTHDIEAVSCDEMLVDCTDVLATTGATPLDFATLLRQELFDKTGCPASAGMGSNILLAKMATRKAKPNGQFYLEPEDALDFISGQTIQNIPGVGWSMSRKLKSMKIETCGDLQKLSLSVLQKEFGPKTGQSLYSYARGQDDRPIKVEQERKSVSAEINYGIRFTCDGDAEKFMLELSEEVHNRLKNIDRKGRSVTLKVMVRRQDAPVETAKFMGHGICNNISKSAMLPVATDDPKIISRECLLLLRTMKVKASDLRGIGIQIQRLETSVLGPPGSKQRSQSILNFTVNKNTSPHKSPLKNTKSPVVKVISPPIQRSVSEAVGSTKQLQFNTSSMQCEMPDHLPSSVSTVTNQTADQRQSVIDLSSVDTEEDKKQDTDFNVLWSAAVEEEEENQKEDFLGGYCHNIVDELSRRKTAKRFLPPLPALPDITGSPEVTAVARKFQVSSATPDYFPSPSQIDPEVLSELPPDIRKQIESEINNRKSSSMPQRHPVTDESPTGNTSATSQLSSFQDVIPGCSHFPDNYQQERQPRKCETANKQKTQSQKCQKEEIMSLPSPSQLDESCLNALPEDIQKEIWAAYTSQLSTNNRKSTTTQLMNLQQASPSKQKSPGKSKSPGRSRKNSPVFKVPRGKPGRGRPKRLNFQSPKQPTLTASIKSQQPQEREKILSALTEITDVEAASENPVTPISQDIIPQHGNRSVVNLCGAVSIQEVRILLKEWLVSTQAPEQDDEDVMVDYLKDLALDHNLEQLDLVVKFLHRNIQRLEMTKWLEAFRRIVDKTQDVVKNIYGCKLKLFSSVY